MHNLYGQEIWDKSLPPFNNTKDKNLSKDLDTKEVEPVWDKSLPPFHNVNASTKDSLYSKKNTYIPQLFLSTFFLEQKDANNSSDFSNPLNNISFGFTIYNNIKQNRIYEINRIIFGLTLEDAKTDFRQDYIEPVPDSILISHFQVFGRIYNTQGNFLSIFIPVGYNKYTNINIDNVRVGIGYTIGMNKYLDLDLHYNMLVYPNKDGFRKGIFTLGLSKSIDIKLK